MWINFVYFQDKYYVSKFITMFLNSFRCFQVNLDFQVDSIFSTLVRLSKFIADLDIPVYLV